MSETLELETRGAVGILRLNRPEVRNAVNEQMRTELRQALLQVTHDASIRGLVLTGAGQGFCSGGDINGMLERQALGAQVAGVGWRRQHELHHTLSLLYHLDRPTVAAVNGAAFGLGLDLALSCDFIFAAETATLSAGFVHRGLVPDGGGLYYLPRRVGLARAKDLIFSGRSVAAAEALDIGLADRVLPPDSLLDTAVSYVEQLAALPATAQALAKSILNRTFELSLEEANALGAQAQAVCYTTPEHQASVQAFLSRRKAAQR